MQTLKSFVALSVLLGLLISPVIAEQQGSEQCQSKVLAAQPQAVLHCFMVFNSRQQPEWSLIETQKAGDVTIYRYHLVSQFWPEEDISDSGTRWQHSLTLYKPARIRSSQALLLVNGGTLNPDDSNPNPPAEDMDGAQLARQSQTLVADLTDIPNQYLQLDDGVPRREDGIVAYSWNRYMDNPEQAYWPVHLPMAKAVVVAMDTVQAIAEQQQWPVPQQFVLAGASKRGWAAWRRWPTTG